MSEHNPGQHDILHLINNTTVSLPQLFIIREFICIIHLIHILFIPCNHHLSLVGGIHFNDFLDNILMHSGFHIKIKKINDTLLIILELPTQYPRIQI